MNLKYEVGQKVPVIHSTPVAQTETILNISVGKKGAKYGTSSGAYTEAELDAFTANSMNKPAEDKPKFKVGDKVQFHGKCSECKGKVVTLIERTEGDGNWLTDNAPRGENHSIWNEECFHLYVPSFDWDAFKAGKIAVHCDSEEKAKAFLKECEEQKILWNSGDIPTDKLNFGRYEGGAYYDIVASALFYDSKEWCEEHSYTIIDYPFSEQPAEPTEQKEPIKLYCVKDYGSYFSASKIYEFCDGSMSTNCDPLDRLGDGYDSLDHFFKVQPHLKDCLVPLVKRPAKVGEYIVPMVVAGYAKHDGRYDQYDLLKVTQDDSNIIDQWIGKAVGFENITHPDRQWHNCVICHDDYLVLDGYQPEPEAEKEPEYYSGKVVCVENKYFEDFWTVGKVYEFKDGFAVTDGGYKSPMDYNAPIKKFDDLKNIYSSNIKFIEFKGEAHADA